MVERIGIGSYDKAGHGGDSDSDLVRAAGGVNDSTREEGGEGRRLQSSGGEGEAALEDTPTPKPQCEPKLEPERETTALKEPPTLAPSPTPTPSPTTIHSLPSELLGSIMTYTASYCPDAPLILSLVSRRWRSVAKGTPTVWTRLRLVLGPPVKHGNDGYGHRLQGEGEGEGGQGGGGGYQEGGGEGGSQGGGEGGHHAHAHSTSDIPPPPSTHSPLPLLYHQEPHSYAYSSGNDAYAYSSGSGHSSHSQAYSSGHGNNADSSERQREKEGSAERACIRKAGTWFAHSGVCPLALYIDLTDAPFLNPDGQYGHGQFPTLNADGQFSSLIPDSHGQFMNSDGHGQFPSLNPSGQFLIAFLRHARGRLRSVHVRAPTERGAHAFLEALCARAPIASASRAAGGSGSPDEAVVAELHIQITSRAKSTMPSSGAASVFRSLSLLPHLKELSLENHKLPFPKLFTPDLSRLTVLKVWRPLRAQPVGMAQLRGVVRAAGGLEVLDVRARVVVDVAAPAAPAAAASVSGSTAAASNSTALAPTSMGMNARMQEKAIVLSQLREWTMKTNHVEAMLDMISAPTLEVLRVDDLDGRRIGAADAFVGALERAVVRAGLDGLAGSDGLHGLHGSDGLDGLHSVSDGDSHSVRAGLDLHGVGDGLHSLRVLDIASPALSGNWDKWAWCLHRMENLHELCFASDGEDLGRVVDLLSPSAASAPSASASQGDTAFPAAANTLLPAAANTAFPAPFASPSAPAPALCPHLKIIRLADPREEHSAGLGRLRRERVAVQVKVALSGGKPMRPGAAGIGRGFGFGSKFGLAKKLGANEDSHAHEQERQRQRARWALVADVDGW